MEVQVRKRQPFLPSVLFYLVFSSKAKVNRSSGILKSQYFYLSPIIMFTVRCCVFAW